MKKTDGVTLIEFMLALLLSSSVLFGSMMIYLTMQKNYSLQAALMTIQENTQVIFSILSASIRTAGYLGCAKLTNDFPFMSYPPFTFTPKNKISTFKSNEIKEKTDGITIRQAALLNATLVRTMFDYHTLYVSLKPEFKQSDILIVSDCKTAEMIVADKVFQTKHYQMITTKRPLTKLYETLTEISQFEMTSYFIGKTNRTNAQGKAIYALYAQNIHSHKTEIIDGVHHMEIRFSTWRVIR